LARIRSVHPGLFTDEAFVTLSPFARLLLIGIWTECDDQGAFEWKPVTLKMRLLAVDNVDVPTLLAELERANTVKRYAAEGREYGAVRNFRKYQRPKKPNCVHPMPDELRTYVALTAVSTELDDDEDAPVPPKSEIPPQMEDGGGRVGEEEGDTSSLRSDGAGARTTKKRRKPETALPPDWRPSESDRAYAKAKGLTDRETDREAERFRNNAGQNGRLCRDWSAAWRNWVIKALELLGREPRLDDGSAPTPQAYTINPKSPSWAAWRAYYAAIGKRFPVSEMDRIAETCGQWTVPSEWPPGHADAA